MLNQRSFFSIYAAIALCTTVSAADINLESADSQQKYLFSEHFFLSEEERKTPFILQITGQQFVRYANRLKQYLNTYGKALTLEIDVRRGDGLVDQEGTLQIPNANSYQIISLIIKNTTGDVTAIGNFFLYGCHALTALDLTPLQHVTAIGNAFLCNCRGLTALDLTPLQQVTAIGNGFLSNCHGLTALDLTPLQRVTAIGDYFLCNCRGLTALDLTPLQQVTAIGNGFLCNCRGLTALDLTPLQHVTAIGDSFLCNCRGLTALDLTPLQQVTAIGDCFLSGCRGLTALDLTPLQQVTAIGDSFLYGCQGLTALDLTPLQHVTAIGNFFLYGCHALTALDLTPLQQVTAIGCSFLFGCQGLTAVRVSEHTARIVIEKVVNRLRESNNRRQQELGNELYQQYPCSYAADLNKLLSLWNMPRIKLMNPKELPDLPEMTGDTVLNILTTTWKTLQYSYEIKTDDGQTITDTYLPPERAQHANTFFNIIKSCFGDNSVQVPWKMYQENLPQMQIAFKHMAVGFNTLITTHKGRLEATTHFGQLLDGFQHCQSRQAMLLNQVLVSMGKSALEGSERENVLWSVINAFKLQAFTQFVGDVGDRTHEYARKFTVINNAVGLPVAIQSFQERISRVSDQEISEHLSTFFGTFFTKEALIGYVTQEILNRNSTTADASLDEIAKNPFSYQNLRTVLWNVSGHSGSNNPSAYFQKLSGIDMVDEEWDYETTPLSFGEIEALLAGLGCLAVQTSEASKPITDDMILQQFSF